jgi:hypothetical protein
MRKVISLNIVIFVLAGFLVGCACLKESGKKVWGSSTQALDKEREKGKQEEFSCSLSDCFDACLNVLDKLNSLDNTKVTVFEKDKKAGFIVAMGFKKAIDTTEVGIYFKQDKPGKTIVQIISLNHWLLEEIAPEIFSKLKEEIKK